ncbi:MAG: D-aminoacyl-tRNA deacylase [Solirubrobacteraceae bacterium]
MRALVQRVSRAEVRVDGVAVSSIGSGVVVLLGVRDGDGLEQAQRLARKLLALRIFADAQGRTNESLGEREILCVSQFTLYADTNRGNRPSFARAAAAEVAQPLYERFCELTGAARGVFGAEMEVELVGDGPLTVLLEA